MSPCENGGECLKVTQEPGYKCRCEGTGFHGVRCTKCKCKKMYNNYRINCLNIRYILSYVSIDC